MVSFLSIFDQVSNGVPAQAVAWPFPPSDEAPQWDDKTLNEMMASLMQSLQSLQVPLPPQEQPLAQQTLALLDGPPPEMTQVNASEAMPTAQVQILQASLQESLVALDAAVPSATENATSWVAPTSPEPIAQAVLPQPTAPTAQTPSAQMTQPVDTLAQKPDASEPAPASLALFHRDAHMLMATAKHVAKLLSKPHATTPASLKTAMAKLSRVVDALQDNPATPPQLAEKLATLGGALPPAPPEALGRDKSPVQALIHRLNQALDKAPEAWKPVIEETLAQLAKPREKAVHPVQLELDLHRTLGEAKKSKSAEEKPTEASLAPVTLDAPLSDAAPATDVSQPLDVPVQSETVPPSDAVSPQTTEAIGPRLEPLAAHRNAPAAPADRSAQASEDLPPHAQVVQHAKMTLEAGRKQVTMQLNPHQLGQVHLKITSHANHQVSIRLMTQTAEAYGSLDKSVSQLVKSLEDQGLNIRDVQLVQAGADWVSANSGSQNTSNDNSPTHGQGQSENRFDFNQQQSQSQSQHSSFQQLANGQAQSGTSNPFTDEGSSTGEDVASSQIAFDTDVEGEEVNLGPVNNSTTGIDIRI